MVAHALQVVGDLERGGEHAEVARHGLLEGEQVDALLLDFHLHVVDGAVVGDDLAGLVGVALQERLHGQAQRGLGLARHGQQAHLDGTELVMKVAVRLEAHPNLPVI